MPKTISLPFTGNFKHCQKFGANPDGYKKFGLRGHDGDDWLIPHDTIMKSPTAVRVMRVGFDATGWGKYLQLWDKRQSLLINMCHMHSVNVAEGDEVKWGDEVARSGNSGNSSAPHLHIAVADTGADGKKLNVDNGHKGWYSILDSQRIQLVSFPKEDAETIGIKSVKELLFFGDWMARLEYKLDKILRNQEV